MPSPIYSALYIVRAAIFAALDPLTTSPIYWQQAAQGVALPFVVYQSQDSGGKADKYLNAIGWEGLITVKALANNQGAAETLINTVAPGMASLASIGYTLCAEYERPIVIPPDPNGVWQAAHQWRVYLETA